MKTIAIYNIKGGVGKTTTAVNLSYLAAETGQRTLLWDLDPQAASTFAYRIDPHVAATGKRSLADGFTVSASIKQTDYDNLYLLPADFASRKLDGWLGSFRKPERLFGSVLESMGRDFDVVFLDCPAGFSRLAETTVALADVILAPTIPAVLSLRMVARLIKQAQRSKAPSTLALFFNMVDRRKTLHHRACEVAAAHAEIFLGAHVPYASVVEQLAARRMPIAAFAPHEPATRAFGEIWHELEARLRPERDCRDERKWIQALHGLESLIEQLETAERPLSPAVAPIPTDVGNIPVA